MSKFITAKVLHENYANNFKNTRFNTLAKTNDGKEDTDIVILNEMMPDDFLYVSCRALTANVPNANGDLFTKEELLRIDENTNEEVYKSFIGCGVFKNHDSENIESNIGLIYDVAFIDDENDPHVDLIIGIDKVKAEDIARGLKTGRINSVSMGCSISYSTCTVCNKKILQASDECDCLKYHRGQKVNGIIAAEQLFGVSFFEISIVSVPADFRARIINILASNNNGRIKKVAFNSEFLIIDEIYKKIINCDIKDKIKILNELK